MFRFAKVANDAGAWVDCAGKPCDVVLLPIAAPAPAESVRFYSYNRVQRVPEALGVKPRAVMTKTAAAGAEPEKAAKSATKQKKGKAE